MANEANPNPEAHLYIGASYLQLDNQKETIEAYDTLINSNALNRSKGYWFKALAYLKFGEEEKAKAALVQIKNNPTFFKHQEAIELLDKL